MKAVRSKVRAGGSTTSNGSKTFKNGRPSADKKQVADAIKGAIRRHHDALKELERY